MPEGVVLTVTGVAQPPQRPTLFRAVWAMVRHPIILAITAASACDAMVALCVCADVKSRQLPIGDVVWCCGAVVLWCCGAVQLVNAFGGFLPTLFQVCFASALVCRLRLPTDEMALCVLVCRRCAGSMEFVCGILVDPHWRHRHSRRCRCDTLMASVACGTDCVLFCAGGALFGGWVLKRWQLSVRGMGVFITACSVLCTLCLFSLFMHCPTPALTGFSAPYAPCCCFMRLADGRLLRAACRFPCLCVQVCWRRERGHHYFLQHQLLLFHDRFLPASVW